MNLDPCKLYYLAILILVLSFGYFAAVTFISIPDTGEDNAKYIVGFLVGTGVGSIISFYFRRKDNIDLQQADTVTNTTTSTTVDTTKK